MAGVVGRGKGGWRSKSKTADSCAYLKPKKIKTRIPRKAMSRPQKLFSPRLLYLHILLFDFDTCISKLANYTSVAETRTL